MFLQQAFVDDLFDHGLLIARAKLVLERCLRGTVEASLGSMSMHRQHYISRPSATMLVVMLHGAGDEVRGIITREAYLCVTNILNDFIT